MGWPGAHDPFTRVLGSKTIFRGISPEAAPAALRTALRELIAGGAPLEPPRGLLLEAPRGTLFLSRWWPKVEKDPVKPKMGNNCRSARPTNE